VVNDPMGDVDFADWMASLPLEQVWTEPSWACWFHAPWPCSSAPCCYAMDTVASWMMCLHLVQFHPLFISTRTLPNTFAYELTNLAWAWMVWPDTLMPAGRRAVRLVSTLAVACAVFHSELVLLAGLMLLLDWAMRDPCWRAASAQPQSEPAYVGPKSQTRFLRLLIGGLIASILAITLTLCVDSWFWQRPWYWPEWHVFAFNALRDGSRAWDTSPWHAYWTLLLPKITGISLPLALAVPWVRMDRAGRFTGFRTLVPVLCFVGAYSCLGECWVLA
jgi:alpha-1,6-mannosyltransferase